MTIKSTAGKSLEKHLGPLTMATVLRSFRQCDEMTQVDFAEKLGISKQTLCDIEKSRKLVSPSRAARFAKKLGYSPEHWMTIALQDELRAEGLKLKIEVRITKAA